MGIIAAAGRSRRGRKRKRMMARKSQLNVIPVSRAQRIEKFIEQFCEDAFTSAAAQDPKRFLKYSHLCKWT
ncbi:hypothetical protein SAY87_008819 [Trapa incisa]|uniref:Uncharacterized protein n=1 Tax=Trapa incisa TaxID=236973 RepID=A0AAN7JXU3_9MYRT|nr:hypothetical protein SAY87_008819 [Trapa incisa]